MGVGMFILIDEIFLGIIIEAGAANCKQYYVGMQLHTLFPSLHVLIQSNY